MENEWLLFLQMIFGGLGVIFLALIFLLLVVIISFGKGKKAKDDDVKFKVIHLNKKLADEKQGLFAQILSKKQLKKTVKLQKETDKEKKQDDNERKKVFVLDFDGDIGATHVPQLRQQINLLLSVIGDKDEVLVKLESQGGYVHAYGLAAAQLARLRERKIPLTICVDKVAASGGYLMACVANKIVAAPFAILGSIGVVGNVPNVHNLLKKNGVEYYEMTAGEYKRTVTMLGEVTEKGKAKFVEQLESTHSLFKNFLLDYRPQLEIEKVATGEYWFGKQAKSLNLVDELKTSDEIVYAMMSDADVYLLKAEKKESFKQKIMDLFSGSLASLIGSKIKTKEENNYPMFY